MKRILAAFTALFFAWMAFLTFSARAIHNAALPHVAVRRVELVFFPHDEGSRQAIAVTKEQFEQGVYVLYTAEVNGEKRDFIRRADIVPGQEYGGYVEVLAGLMFNERIVVDADRQLSEGEVILMVGRNGKSE